MLQFKRGQIFKANLPKTKFIPNKINPPTPLVYGEKYVVLLHDSDNPNYDEHQVLIAPIVSEKELIKSGQTILLTHIPINKLNCSSIEENSFVCTHQIMPINRSWLSSTLFTEISKTDLMYKIDLGIINSANLTNLIESFIEEKAHELKIKYTRSKKTPIESSSNSVRNFKRGDVFYSQMPQQIFNLKTQPPSYTLNDEHMVVVLHDSNDVNYDPSQVLIVPITSASSAVKNDKLLPTHISVSPENFSFIKKESYISTHQIMPINREWLDKRTKGSVGNSKMLEIDLGIVLASDLNNSIHELIELKINELTEKALNKLSQNSNT